MVVTSVTGPIAPLNRPLDGKTRPTLGLTRNDWFVVASVMGMWAAALTMIAVGSIINF